MNSPKRFFFIVVIMCCGVLYAREWIVLQQGVENYDGCDDITLLTNTNGNNTHMSGWDAADKDALLLCQYKKDNAGELNEGQVAIVFNLSPVPTSIEVDSAVLSVYRTGSFWNSDTFPNLDKNATFEVRKVSKKWSSSNASWANLASSFEPELLDSVTYTTGTSRWYAFDVTTAITEFMADSTTNFGFMLFSKNEAPDTNSGSVSKFHSSEFATPSLRPMLTIFYTVIDTIAPVAEFISPNGGEVFDEGDITHMIFSATDDIGVTSRKVEFSSDSGATWTLLDSAAWSPSYTWTIPGISSKNCLLKMTAYDIGSNFDSDETDTTFEIIAVVSITASDTKGSNLKINSFNKAGLQLSTPVTFSADVFVYSADGTLVKKIKTRQFKSGNNHVAFKKQLSNGIYLVEICGKELTISKKFIVTE